MRGWIYDTTVKPLTSKWYREVLSRIPAGAHLLDVGIGTGGALAQNATLVRRKGIRITGVDIDEDYVKRCRRQLDKNDLSEHVDVRLCSIYDHLDRPYDAVYFSGSFMLMPEPDRALRHVMALLADDGLVFFTQTFQDKKSPLLEKAKPLLHKFTTIEFGTVTYESDFIEVLSTAGLDLLELTTMSRGRDRSSRLAIGRPAPLN